MRLHDTLLLACCRCSEPHANYNASFSVVISWFPIVYHPPAIFIFQLEFLTDSHFMMESRFCWALSQTSLLSLLPSFSLNRIMYTYFPNSRKLLSRTVYVSLRYKMYFLLWKCCADCKFGYYANTSQNGSELRVPGSQSSYYTKRTAFPRGNLRLSRNVNAFNGIPTSPSQDSFPRAQIALRPARPFYIPEASPQMETAS